MAGELFFSQEEQERAKLRSRRKYQTDLQSNLATAEDNGIAKGIAKGIAMGRTDTMVATIKNLMDSQNWSMEQAMTALNLSQEERLKYKALLNG